MDNAGKKPVWEDEEIDYKVTSMTACVDYKVMDECGLSYIALNWKADIYYMIIYTNTIDLVLRILLPVFVMRRNYSQIYKLVQLWEPDGRRQTLFSMTAVFVVTMVPKV